MIKRRRCEELAEMDGVKYLFAGTFGNIEAYSYACGEPFAFYQSLLEGELPPTKIHALLECCLSEVNAKEVPDMDKQEIIENFIEQAGLNDSAVMCRHILTHAILGDIKKKQMDRQKDLHQLKTKMIRRLRLLNLMSFGNRGLLWVMICATFLISLCMILMFN